MATTINACFDEIDQLQNSTYRVINIISEANYVKDSDELPEVARSSKVKEANELIKQIPDLLCVIDVALKNSNHSEEGMAYLREKYDLYSIKVTTLKDKLKEAQLEAYKKENESIHEQILTKYNCAPAKSEIDKENKPLSTDLFAGRSAKSEAKNGKSVEDQITTHNKNITSSLKQTRQLMTMSVMQTELNIDSLDQQYKDLLKFNSKMMDMETILLKSRQIVKFIERQDQKDKRRIYFAVGFLLLCSAWVLWRRVLKTPFKILMWTILKTFGLINWITAKAPTEKISYGMSSDGHDGKMMYSSITPTTEYSSLISESSLTTEKPTQTLSYMTWDPTNENGYSSNSDESLYLEYSPTTIPSSVPEEPKPREESETEEPELTTSQSIQDDIIIAAEFDEPEVLLTEVAPQESQVESDVLLEEALRVLPTLEQKLEAEVISNETPELTYEANPIVTSEALDIVPQDINIEELGEPIENTVIEENSAEDTAVKDIQAEITNEFPLGTKMVDADIVQNELQNHQDNSVEEQLDEAINGPMEELEEESHDVPEVNHDIDSTTTTEADSQDDASIAVNHEIHDEL